MFSRVFSGIRCSGKAPEPIFMQIEPTSTCNLNCKMCLRKELPYTLNKNMSFETFKKILSTFPKLKVINLTGFGEPLLNRNLAKMIAYASKKGIYVDTITNGTTLNKNNVRQIFEAGLNRLILSIDGTDKIYYNLRGISNKKVMHALDIALDVKKELGVKTAIVVNTVLLPDNVDDLIKLGKSLPSDIIWNIKTIRSTKKYNRFFADKKISKIKKANKHIKKIQYSRYIHTPFCFKIHFGAYINYAGEMYPCCNLFDNMNFGNILKKDAWNSKKFQIFRKTFNYHYPEKCKICNLTFNQNIYATTKFLRRNHKKAEHKL